MRTQVARRQGLNPQDLDPCALFGRYHEPDPNWNDLKLFASGEARVGVAEINAALGRNPKRQTQI